MWTNDLLKQNAKTVLARSYWQVFVLCLVAGLLTGDGVGRIRLTTKLHEFRDATALFFGIAGLAGGLIYLLLVANILQVGWRRYMMENRSGHSPFDTLFSGFSGEYTNLVAAQFAASWRIWVYSLLLVVPGIIKSYEYRMVPYLLAENPTLTPARALELSSAMTDGEKLNIFLLDLSFAGWMLLGALCFGVGTLFVAPYYEATHAELYAALRAKAFAAGLTDAGELGGFHRYEANTF